MKEPGSYTLDFYVQHGGYEAMRKAVSMTPEAIIDELKKSGLRGRGGAGFPTGMKWGFVPKDIPKPKYLLINADESEPGTFKDHVLLERNPHLLLEGCVIGCRAIGAKVCYIYIRGEFYHLQRQLEAEIAKARAAGYLGQNILGSGQDCEIYVHRGAGAYEAGEETALIESLEGQARPAAHQAAVPGRRRPLRLPDRGQQRRDRLQRAADHRARRRLVHGDRAGEEPGAEAVLRQRPRQAPGRLRGAHGRDAARADLRLRRRHPQRPQASRRSSPAGRR